MLVGLLMVTAGHGGAARGLVRAAPSASLLDGALAPLRNVHKFDLAHPAAARPGARPPARSPRRSRANGDAAARAAAVGRDAVGDRLTYAGVLLLSVASVAGLAGPALRRPARCGQRLRSRARLLARRGGLARPERATTPPRCWSRGRASASTCGAIPTTSRCSRWLDSPWAVRNAVPLAPAGNIRMLDAIEEQLAAGRPSTGLARLPAPRGHRTPRGPQRSAAGRTRPAPVLVHQALDGSPGIRRVARLRPRRRQPGPHRVAGATPPSSTTGGCTVTRPSRSTRSTARTGPSWPRRSPPRRRGTRRTCSTSPRRT